MGCGCDGNGWGDYWDADGIWDHAVDGIGGGLDWDNLPLDWDGLSGMMQCDWCVNGIEMMPRDIQSISRYTEYKKERCCCCNISGVPWFVVVVVIV